MSALEMPCGDDFLTSVAHMTANQGCIVSASIREKFLPGNLELALDYLDQSSVSASLDG